VLGIRSGAGLALELEQH